jgi:VanZ family protein
MVTVAQSRARVWVPVVLWAGLIFGLSSIPSLASGLGTWDDVLRKLAHAGEFAVLGAFLQRATASAPVAILLGSAYAATDEVHQRFVEGRVGSPVDWAIDTAGVAIGVYLLLRWRRRR